MPSLDRLPIHESPRTMYPWAMEVYRTATQPGDVCHVRWIAHECCEGFRAVVLQVGCKPFSIDCPTHEDLDALLISIAEDEGWVM